MQPKKVGGPYQFTTNENYEDYSSGRVLYGATGATNFPVRLISEIFLRSKYYLTEQGNPGPYSVYDPFCGAGYSLTVLGLLHGADIKSIYATDADENILDIAKKNLSLLTKKGIDTRVSELHNLFNDHRKNSHKDAINSASRLSKSVSGAKIATQLHTHNALSIAELPFELSSTDLIITDLPYGKLANWSGANGVINPTQQFLNNIKKSITPKTLIAISINKKQEASYEGFHKIKSFKIGTRKVLFLQPS